MANLIGICGDPGIASLSEASKRILICYFEHLRCSCPPSVNRKAGISIAFSIFPPDQSPVQVFERSQLRYDSYELTE